MEEQRRINQKQDDRLENLEKGQEEIIKLLTPISETYTTVSLLGKWITAFAVLISIVIGIVIELKNLIKR